MLHGKRQIGEAAPITSANIVLRHVVAAREDAISNSFQIDLDFFRANINENDFEISLLCVQHHLQITLSGKSCLHSKTLRVFQVPLGGCKNLPGGGNGRESRSRGLKGVRDGVGVKNRSWAEQFRVPASKGGLSGPICSGNESKCWTIHWREGAACGRGLGCGLLNISRSRFFSIATPARAACAIF